MPKSFKIVMGDAGLKKVIFDGKDITDSVHSISCEGSVDEIARVTMEFIPGSVEIDISDVRIVPGYRYVG